MIKKTIRDIDIVASEQKVVNAELEIVEQYKINGEDDNVADIIYVKVDATDGGNGTYENPFFSIDDAEANSKEGPMIYVYASDIAYESTDGIDLKSGQTIIGQSNQKSLSSLLGIEEGIINEETVGDDKNAILTATATDLNNRVGIINIDGTDDDLTGDIKVLNLKLTGDNVSGVVIKNVGAGVTGEENYANILIKGNNIDGLQEVDGGGGHEGIYVKDVNVKLNIKNNDFKNIADDAVYFTSSNDNNTIVGNIENNNFTNIKDNDYRDSIDINDSNVSGNISGNVITESDGFVIYNSSITGDISNNDITARYYGIYNYNGTIEGNVSNNTITAETVGIYNGTITGNILGNTISHVDANNNKNSTAISFSDSSYTGNIGAENNGNTIEGFESGIKFMGENFTGEIAYNDIQVSVNQGAYDNGGVANTDISNHTLRATGSIDLFHNLRVFQIDKEIKNEDTDLP